MANGSPLKTLEIEPKTNLLTLDLEGMESFLENMGERKFRARQIFKWIHKHLAVDFATMTDLSLSLRAKLEEGCEIKAPAISSEQISQDGTIKWLFELLDHNYIEAVFIPEDDRGTLCISSQAGCALDCSFCSTGKQGFNRNLDTAEIIGQIWQAARRLVALSNSHQKDHQNTKDEHYISDESYIGDEPRTSIVIPANARIQSKRPEITNVVMMGMGEPLLNLDAVAPALAIMRHDLAYKLGRRKVTVSTAGVVPKIDELSTRCDVALALSLHAPVDELRNVLVPINKKYPIATLLEACRRYVGDDHRRHVLIEYVMLQGVNDSTQHAKQLARILEGLPCKINLIPFNPHPGSQYQRSKTEDIQLFRNILIRAGYIATVRKTRGDDIDAACGQLAGKIIDRTTRSARWKALRATVKEDSTWGEKRAC